MLNKNLLNKQINTNNSTNSIAEIYSLRTLYKDTILPDQYFPYKFDLWYTNKFYGKIDLDNNAILPSERFLVNISTDDTIVNVFDFVAFAYQDMVAYYKTLQQSNVASKARSPYRTLIPVKGYTSIYEAYDTHSQTLFKSFLAFVQNQKINDFNDYYKLLLEFLKNTNKIIPITRSSYVTSKINSLSSTGLSIELNNNYKFDDDLSKINFFINDTNFEVFLDAARRFGFFIDKNAPWRIVADISSPAMLPYMKRVGITTLEDFFRKRFYKAYKTDLPILKFYMTEFYNSYVDLNPISFKQKLTCNSYINETVELKKLSQIVLEQRFDSSFFNRLYLYVKALETSQLWSQQEFENYVRNANQLTKFVGEDAGLDYMNSLFFIKKQDPNKDSLTSAAISSILLHEPIERFAFNIEF